MPNSTTTKLCSWWDVNYTASDPFNTCASTSGQPTTIAQYGAPDNLYGSQQPRSGNGYVGFVAYRNGSSSSNSTIHELRSYANTPLSAPLLAGRTYYAEYWVSLAEGGFYGITSLGMAVSRSQPGQATDGLLTQVDQVVNRYAANGTVLDDRTGWQRVAGTFRAAGGESHFTIGCFEPNPSLVNAPGAATNQYNSSVGLLSAAYYYADDALLTLVPQAGPEFVARCGQPITLPVDGAAIANNIDVLYRWTSSTDPNFSSSTLITTVTPTASNLPTVYTLTITIPGQAPIVSQTTMYVQCCVIQTRGALVNLDQGTYYGVAYSFQPNTRYYVPQDLHLKGGTFSLPASSTLYLEANVNIFVDDNATLELAGGHITAACDNMWGGLYVGNQGNLLTNMVRPGERASIAHSRYGVVFTQEAPDPFELNDTDFLFNYQSVTFQDINANERLGNISRCTFDSAPLGMLAPYQYQSVSDFYYSFRHVSILQSSQFDLTLTDNQLRRGMVGLYTTKSSSPVLTSNIFQDNFVAGVYTDSPAGSLTPMTGNTFRAPSFAVHDANPPQITDAYNQTPGSSIEESYALLANGYLSYQPQSNHFYGWSVLHLPDPVPTYRQVGISATTDTPFSGSSIRPRDNHFADLYEGMRVQLKAYTSITENEFADCVYGLHLVGPGAGGPPNRFRVQCNTFSWPAGAQFGTSNTPRGIFIGPNYAVELTGNLSVVPPNNTATSLLKNYFDNQSTAAVTDVWNDPSNASFTYDTFYELITNGYGRDLVTTTNVTLSASQTIRTTIGTGNNCSHDGYSPDYGIRARATYSRATTSNTSATSKLESFAPNPAADQTSIHYSLSSADAVQPATLVIRSLISGAIVQELVLPNHEAEATLNTQDLPNGVYAVSLLINGRSLTTRRLLVNH